MQKGGGDGGTVQWMEAIEEEIWLVPVKMERRSLTLKMPVD
jgi:hypothetical protein